MTARTFLEVAKSLTVASVHTPGPIGEDDKKARTFSACVGNVPITKRMLHPNDEKTAKTPFKYDVNALGSLRPDQVPRFLGALTDSDKEDDAEMPLADLVAMQDRVDPDKVEAMRGRDRTKGKKALVIRHGGQNLIADGHHRLAADWMDGHDKAQVKFKDITDVSTALKRRDDAVGDQIKVRKVDESLGLVFGWAIICKVGGKDYYDWNVDHAGAHKGKLVPENVTEDAMLKGAMHFMKDTARPGNEQHAGPDVGTYVFAFPMTTDIAKAMGITTEQTGFMVGYHPTKAVLAKFLDGTYTGFSIEGLRDLSKAEEHDR